MRRAVITTFVIAIVFTVMTCGPTSSTEQATFNWARQNSFTTNVLYGVSALDSKHVWAVGDKGTILFFNGTTWKQQSSGTTATLRGVLAVDASHVWAVGHYTTTGVILFYDGHSWKQQNSHTDKGFIGVFALDTQHVWAVGSCYTIQFFNGSTWANQYGTGGG